jgi:hypothetical protein
MATGLTWIYERGNEEQRSFEKRRKALSHAATVSHRDRRARRLKHAQCHHHPSYFFGSAREQVADCWTVQKYYSSNAAFAYSINSPTLKHNINVLQSIGIEPNQRTHHIVRFLWSEWSQANVPAGTRGSFVATTSSLAMAERTTASLSYEALQAVEELPLLLALRKITQSTSINIAALECKNKVMRQAHRNLELIRDSASIDLAINTVIHLYVAATCDANVAEARIHGQTLQKLLHAKARNDGLASIGMGLISFLLAYDVQICHLSMSTSAFDHAYWTRECIEPAIELMSKAIEARTRSHILSLDLSYRAPTLASIVRDIFTLVWMWEADDELRTLLTPFEPAILAVYVWARHGSVQVQLLDHFLAARNKLKHSETIANTTEALMDLYLDTVLPMSLLSYLATFAGNPKLGTSFESTTGGTGRYIWPKIGPFLQQLQLYLRPVSTLRLLAQQGGDSLSAREMLFAYWVGAMWECSDSMVLQHTPADWFTVGFIELAQELGTSDWASVEDILNGFCPSGFARPEGSFWVDGTLWTPQRP